MKFLLALFLSFVQFFKRTSLYIVAFPILCFLLGASLNQLVLIANGNKFPVLINSLQATSVLPFPGGYLDNYHIVMTSETRLNFLADIFDLGTASVSIGDLLLELGAWTWGFAPYLWAFVVIQRLNREE